MTIATLRRTSGRMALLGITVVGLLAAASASASPTITSFKITAVPIPGFPSTGNIRGAGAVLTGPPALPGNIRGAGAVIQGHAAISGTEYGGFPPPLIGIKFYAPSGAKLHPQGFAT